MHARSTVTLARTGAAKRTSVREASDNAKTLIGLYSQANRQEAENFCDRSNHTNMFDRSRYKPMMTDDSPLAVMSQ